MLEKKQETKQKNNYYLKNIEKTYLIYLVNMS